MYFDLVYQHTKKNMAAVNGEAGGRCMVFNREASFDDEEDKEKMAAKKEKQLADKEGTKKEKQLDDQKDTEGRKAGTITRPKSRHGKEW